MEMGTFLDWNNSGDELTWINITEDGKPHRQTGSEKIHNAEMLRMRLYANGLVRTLDTRKTKTSVTHHWRCPVRRCGIKQP